MKRQFIKTGSVCLLLAALAACGGSEDDTIKKSDTAKVYQFPVAPAPADSNDMLQPLPADSGHLNMPVHEMPDTGKMPVKKPTPGVKPL